MTNTKPLSTDSKVLGSIGHVSTFHELLLTQSITLGDTVVDATLGNGHDAALLLTLIGSKGHLYGFDVQPSAIDSSRNRLDSMGYSNYQLICDSHEHMSNYIDSAVTGFVFNLGYLPKGDKQLTTTWVSTQSALKQALDLVKPNGFISVMTYPGHAAGKEEDEAIASFFSQLDQKKYQIAQTQFINQQNNPPKLYWLTKRLTK